MRWGYGLFKTEDKNNQRSGFSGTPFGDYISAGLGFHDSGMCGIVYDATRNHGCLSAWKKAGVVSFRTHLFTRVYDFSLFKP